MLQTLADRQGITASDFIRLFIRQQHEATLEQPTKPKAQKRKAKP